MNIDMDEWRKKITMMASTYDEAILIIETLLGTGAILAMFTSEKVRNIMKVPLLENYAIAQIASFMCGLYNTPEHIEKMSKIELSHIDDIELKMDIILTYLMQVKKERDSTK